MKNAIIIPCYNEEKRLDLGRFAAFLKTHPNYLVCFVNDGSRDATLSMLKSFQTNHLGNVLVYDMPENSGKAEAVRRGTLYVLQNYNVDRVGYLDADLATGFEDFVRLINELEYDEDLVCAFGSRKNGDQNVIERNFLRELASQIIGLLIHFVLRMSIKDTQCGAKVFTRGVATRIFDTPFQSRWLFDIELFVRIKRLYGVQNAMAKILEVPLTAWTEVEGSKISLRDTIDMPSRLIKIAYTYDVQPSIRMVTSGQLNPFQVSKAA